MAPDPRRGRPGLHHGPAGGGGAVHGAHLLLPALPQRRPVLRHAGEPVGRAVPAPRARLADPPRPGGHPGLLRGQPHGARRLGRVAAAADGVDAVPAGPLPGDDRPHGGHAAPVDGPRAAALPVDAAVAGHARPGRPAHAAPLPLVAVLAGVGDPVLDRRGQRVARLPPGGARDRALRPRAAVPGDDAGPARPELHHRGHDLLPQPGHRPGDLGLQRHRQAPASRGCSTCSASPPASAWSG